VVGGIAGVSGRSGPSRWIAFVAFVAPWHFLYFFPLPQGHGWFRPGLSAIWIPAQIGRHRVAVDSSRELIFSW